MNATNIYVLGSGDFCKAIHACDAKRVGNHIFISGQVGVKWGQTMEDFEVLPTYEEQVRQTWLNIKNVLEAAGGAPKDIVQIEQFIVHSEAPDIPFADKVMKIFEIKRELLPDAIPTGSAMGVTHLALPGLMLEIQVEAVVSA